MGRAFTRLHCPPDNSNMRAMDHLSDEIDSLSEIVHPGDKTCTVLIEFFMICGRISSLITLLPYLTACLAMDAPSGRFRKQYYILNMLSDILVHTMYTISLVHSLLSNLFSYLIIFQIVCICENTGIFYTPFYQFSSFPLIRFLSISVLQIQLTTSMSISCAEENKRLDHSRGINMP